MIDHVSIQVRDLATSAAFYDAVLAPLGARRLMAFGDVVGFGTGRPVFWLSTATSADAARETHLAFAAADRATVMAFERAAAATGAEILHTARLWPEYHPNYFGAFARDPDGNNIEAVCHHPA